MKTLRCFLTGVVITFIVTSIFAADELPLKRVVLFSSGVGYFQRDGEVTDNATVELSFKTEQINDLLKSLVLWDLGGGKIAPITYGSRDPISRTLKSFAVDITDNPTLGGLLNRLRGVKAQLVTTSELQGMIVGVEKHRQQVKDTIIEVEVVNLLTADGLRAVPLEQIQKIKLLDERLDGELRKALETLASGLDSQRKPVGLAFTGKGKRQVRVAYILETPIWKTSYRLSLEDKKNFLQGWAIVENTTDEDWKNVSLALVSGRPISFIQDLYQPLYIPRPIIVPESFASLRPPVYEGEVASAMDAPAPPRAPAMQKARRLDKMGEADSRELRGAMPGASERFADGKPATFGGEAGVSSMAAAGEVGELFQYTIDQPVTVARQKSAMIPIVNKEIELEKVSIYNENVQRKFPLNGLRLKNTTGLNLMQGPITVFDGGMYAGDARIEDLQPKEERLISYAMDLATEVEPLQKAGASDMTSVKIVKGTLIVTHKYVREKSYTVKNKSDEKRVVLVEHPFESAWKLITPEKAPERTQAVYRFRVETEPGKSVALDVKEEMVQSQQIAMTNYDADSILFYTRSKVISPRVKEALEKVVAMKMKLNDISRRRNEAQQRINEIGNDQARIRENMRTLPQNSAVYQRYVKTFDDQETEILNLRDQIKKLLEDENKARKEVEDYLVNLQAE